MAFLLDEKKLDFPPYPKRELAFSLSTVQVEAISAVFHQCRPAWEIKRRIVPDDMLFFFVSGRAHFKLQSRVFRAGPGDCLLIPRNTSQSARADPEDPPTVIVIHYHARAFGSIPLTDLVGIPSQIRIPDRAWIEALTNTACREYLHRPLGWQEGLNARVWELVLYFIRHHATDPANSISHGKLRRLALLQPALQKMDETLSNPGTMPAIARSCGYSDAQFRRVFRDAVGLSPIAYLRARRMEIACQLLRETDLKVAEIAGRVGYTEPGFFWSTFRRLIGQTPSNYRKFALRETI